MYANMADIQFATAEIRRGKKIERRNHGAKYNVRICYAGQPQVFVCLDRVFGSGGYKGVVVRSCV